MYSAINFLWFEVFKMKIGIDIGGTKCAVVLGDEKQIIKKIKS